MEYLKISEELYQLAKRLNNCPGVYLFCNEQHYPLYIGKSVNLRNRVLTHFQDAKKNSKKNRLIQQTKLIKWEETAGEISALFREAEMIKTYFPLYNRQLRKQKNYVTIKLTKNKEHLTINFSRMIDIEHLDQHYGLFKSEYEAKEIIKNLCENKNICKKNCGLETQAPCFRSQIGKCSFNCKQNDYLRQHDERLLSLLKEMQLIQWPYSSVIAIKEKCLSTSLEQYTLLYRWCYLGIVRSLNDINMDLAKDKNYVFDKDYYYLAIKAIYSSSKENIIQLEKL